jgi:hypothetical protein
MPLLTELNLLFAENYKYAAPTALDLRAAVEGN